MGRRFAFLIGLAAASLFAASPARADLSTASGPFSTHQNTASADFGIADWADDFADKPVQGDASAQDDARTARAVRQLPPAPSSATLLLSAFASLGAFQVVRNVRITQIGHLPDWYHAGGVRQVRHITALDLEYPTLLPSRFDCPIIAIRPIHIEWIRNVQDRARSLCALISSPRRGPPSPL